MERSSSVLAVASFASATAAVALAVEAIASSVFVAVALAVAVVAAALSSAVAVPEFAVISVPMAASIAFAVGAAVAGEAMCMLGSVCNCSRFSSGSKMGSRGGGETFFSLWGAEEFACAVGFCVGVSC